MTDASSRFWRAALDSLTAHVALLDEHGAIINVNRSWTQFAAQNDLPDAESCPGTGYLALLAGHLSSYPDAERILDGVEAVRAGRRRKFSAVYSIHGPRRQNWYLLRAACVEGAPPASLTVTHANINAMKAVQARGARYAHELEDFAYERAQAEEFEHARNRILEQIARNEILDSVLFEITSLIERQQVDVSCAVLFARNRHPQLSSTRRFPEELSRVLLAQAEALFAEDDLCPVSGLPKALAQPELKPLLLLPVKSNAECLGWLAVADLYSDVQPHSVPLYERTVSLAAIAIGHARLYEKLAFQANYDSLTGLPNRVRWNELLQIAVSSAAAHGHRCAVLTLDLNRFHLVNESYGHRVGDLLLNQVAQRLSRVAGADNAVARLGGNEFGCLITGCATRQQAEEMATRLVGALHYPFEVAGHRLWANAKGGLCHYPEDGEDAARLLRNSALALAEARATGRIGWQRYEAAWEQASIDAFLIESQLRLAIARDEFHLNFQPLVDRAGRIEALEVLLRWNSPELGAVPPGRFIPVAERSTLIVEIGAWVLRQACLQWRAWQLEGLPPVRLAVNLSTAQLCGGHFAEQVAAVLAETRMEPCWLELEVTESAMMTNLQAATAEIGQLRRQGVRIAIDDFGTGYSSLSYLHTLPVDTIKIDRSFVRDLDMSSEDSLSIVRAMIDLAHTLKLSVVAEGVETQVQLDALRKLRCDILQGYLFARPLAAPQVAALLAASEPLPALAG